MKVLVLGCHPSSGKSMHRYKQLLFDGYLEIGFDVEIKSPSQIFSRFVKNSILLKYLIYLEKIVIFPIILITKVQNFDLIHITDHSDAIWANYPWIKNSRVTCHDLIAIKSGLGLISENKTKFPGRIYQKLIMRGLNKTAEILCVSKSTLKDVQILLPNTTSRLLLNPLDPKFQSGLNNKNELIHAPKHFLIVGHNNWRKRRWLSIKIWKSLNSKLNGGNHIIPLLLIGPKLSEFELDLLSESELEAIFIKEYVTDDELKSIYINSIALIQMSLYEGFCWPVLEANFFGCVCICSDIEILREVGPHNLFLENHDEIDTDAIQKVITSKIRKSKCIKSAEYFSWQKFKNSLLNNSIVDTK